MRNIKQNMLFKPKMYWHFFIQKYYTQQFIFAIVCLINRNPFIIMYSFKMPMKIMAPSKGPKTDLTLIQVSSVWMSFQVCSHPKFSSEIFTTKFTKEFSFLSRNGCHTWEEIKFSIKHINYRIQFYD